MKAAMMIAALPTVAAFVTPSLVAKVGGKTLAAKRPARMAMSGLDYAESIEGAPFGDGVIWDPLGFAAKASAADVKKYREAELKHGRVAMLAALGIITAEVFHPLFIGDEYIGAAIYHFQEIEARVPIFWVLTILAIGIVEGETITRGWEKVDGVTGAGDLKDDYVNGDLGFDPLGLGTADKFEEYRTKEVSQEHTDSMIGSIGMIVQELVDSKGILEHFNPTIPP
ncbi:unnamed protein product [Phaeothamnion confervicola]